MARKTVDWMKKSLGGMVQQFDQFTLKLPSYAAAFDDGAQAGSRAGITTKGTELQRTQ